MVLIALYPSFKENFVRNQEKRIKQIESLLHFTKRKCYSIWRKYKFRTKSKMHWFITAYWQSFASSTGNVSRESIKEAKEIFLNFDLSFLTQKENDVIK